VDGSLDETFDPGVCPNAPVNGIATVDYLPEKILIRGEFTMFAGEACKYLARLNPSGTLDPRFNIAYGTDPDSGFNSPVHDINLVGDGRIYIDVSFFLVGVGFFLPQVSR